MQMYYCCFTQARKVKKKTKTKKIVLRSGNTTTFSMEGLQDKGVA